MSGAREIVTRSCPSLEELAAFLDGRLSRPDRESMEAHLADCPRCYEVFAETLRHRLDREGQAGGRVVASPLFGRGRNLRLAAAAVLAVALSGGVLLHQLDFAREWGGKEDLAVGAIGSGGDRARWLRAGEGASTAGALVSELMVGRTNKSRMAGFEGWPTTRGLPDGLDERRRGFRLGVRTVDLQAALLAGDGPRAAGLIDELRFLARGLAKSEAIAEVYGDLLARLEAGERPEELALLAERAAPSMRASLPGPDLALGSWSEIGLLASRAGESGLLAGDGFRALRSGVAAADLSAEIREPLARIDRRLAGGEGLTELGALEADFAALIARGGGSGPF